MLWSCEPRASSFVFTDQKINYGNMIERKENRKRNEWIINLSIISSKGKGIKSPLPFFGLISWEKKNKYMYDGVREIGQLNSTQISTQFGSKWVEGKCKIN